MAKTIKRLRVGRLIVVLAIAFTALVLKLGRIRAEQQLQRLEQARALVKVVKTRDILFPILKVLAEDFTTCRYLDGEMMDVFAFGPSNVMDEYFRILFVSSRPMKETVQVYDIGENEGYVFDVYKNNFVTCNREKGEPPPPTPVPTPKGYDQLPMRGIIQCPTYENWRVRVNQRPTFRSQVVGELDPCTEVVVKDKNFEGSSETYWVLIRHGELTGWISTSRVCLDEMEILLRRCPIWRRAPLP